MRRFENCLRVLIMTSWISALVIVVGLDVFVPGHSLADEWATSDEVALSQAVDEAPATGRVTSPFLKLPPASCGATIFLAAASKGARLEVSGVAPGCRFMGGAVRDRAPPGVQLS